MVVLPPTGEVKALLLMLHGCTQDGPDFARGTEMARWAAPAGVALYFPSQSRLANLRRCWNWFKPRSSEPERLAAKTRELAAEHGATRVWVAGMSAGAAMAAILAYRFPELFQALGAHSGLPPGAAQDLSGAIQAMAEGAPPVPAAARPVPSIVFHGAQDEVVHASNARKLLDTMLGGPQPATQVCREAGYTRELFASGELWTVNGLGHAWSGGNPAGSHTSAEGPCAAAEMLRFFQQA